jgi:hypothetical protein
LVRDVIMAAGDPGGPADGGVDAGKERMSCFTWGDPFTTNIWGPPVTGTTSGVPQ